MEFAVEDGVPYAIDFMNPAPDADLHSVGPANFEWVVNAVAELAVRKATDRRRWTFAGRHAEGRGPRLIDDWRFIERLMIAAMDHSIVDALN